MSRVLRLPTRLYQQFDADISRPVPAESYGGWTVGEVDLSLDHTAVVVMHAWDCGRPEEYPGWRRAVEYHGRAERILRDVFPPLLRGVRHSGLPLFHVVGGGRDYYSHLPGHRRARTLAGPTPERLPVAADPVYDALRAQRPSQISPGRHNQADIAAGFEKLDFAPTARPVGDEGIAEDAPQLAALCRAAGINHLIYAGFAINWCLLMSPGGMVDMARHGVICSALEDAVTAVENRETAREEREKQQALWRVSLEFGFVFSSRDLLAGLAGAGGSASPAS
ncbi:MAG: isochorismatase family protein [Verrucomicrobia bacterium]|nr:isochorismatase family protein [Verrucomicrobiota bacterium]